MVGFEPPAPCWGDDLTKITQDPLPPTTESEMEKDIIIYSFGHSALELLLTEEEMDILRLIMDFVRDQHPRTTTITGKSTPKHPTEEWRANCHRPPLRPRSLTKTPREEHVPWHVHNARREIHDRHLEPPPD